jgi:hypothetical protein
MINIRVFERLGGEGVVLKLTVWEPSMSTITVSVQHGSSALYVLSCSLQIITVCIVQAVASVSLKNLIAVTSLMCLVLLIRFLHFQLPYRLEFMTIMVR